MINEIEIASRSRENVTHTLFLDEKGKAVGCTCDEAKAVHIAKYNFKPCSHMIVWNDTQAQEQAAKDAARTAYLYYELSMGI
jgi:hypothetical protein